MHIEANKIVDASLFSGWYCGNKEQFIKRHVKAVAMLREFLKPNATIASTATKKDGDG